MLVFDQQFLLVGFFSMFLTFYPFCQGYTDKTMKWTIK